MKHLARAVTFLLFLTIGLSGAWGGMSPFMTQLSAAIQKIPSVRENPGMNRLYRMRFYFPSDQVAQREGFWEQFLRAFSDKDQERAIAFYLYQMYISSAAYGQLPQGRLTVNQLGVLDGLERLPGAFDVRKAPAFYQKHKSEIKNWLKLFFSKAHLPVYRESDVQNDSVELNFLRILASSADGKGRAGYRLDDPQWKSSLKNQEAARLTKLQRLAQQEIARKVVLYQVNKADLSAADKMTARGNNRSLREYLYRPAAKECAASAYVTGSCLCEQLAAHSSTAKGISRVYQLHMRPQGGGVLQAAGGKGFYAPSGTKYPEWYYHEAVLIIVNRGREYTPVVLDKFLFDNPVELEDWLALFDQRRTVLYATPFQRWEDTEERLVCPDRKTPQGIVKEGRTYHPYPVEE